MIFRGMRASRLAERAVGLFRARPDPAIEDIRRAFDETFYRQQYPDMAETTLSPVAHYFTIGWKEGRDPTAKFSTRYYLENNADVAEAGLNPLWHFMVAGRLEKRRSRPAMGFEDPEILPVVDDIRSDFDAVFYLDRYPDVAETAADPITHYCQYGWKEARDPSPDFSTSYYLQSNPDVAAAGLNPFWHYIATGRAEGRHARPSSGDDNAALSEVIETLRHHFDAETYLQRYPELAEHEFQPLEHYCLIGWKEGRDPTRAFSTSYYLADNPDVRDAGLNPYWHYLVAGRAEGRIANHPGGDRARILRTLRPLDDMAAQWQKPFPRTAMMSATALAEKILGGDQSQMDRLVISISHDDYIATSGGVQYCLQREETLSPSYRSAYLNLHPIRPLPRLARPEEDDDPVMSLVLAGDTIGHAPISAVIDATRIVAGLLSSVHVVIHHLLGHSPEKITELVQATGQDVCFLWLHDYFTLCPSYTLQRNTLVFCGAPHVGSNACTLCVYGQERAVHVIRIRRLFDALKVHVIAPSAFMADDWTDRTDLPFDRMTLLPHLTLHWQKARRRSVDFIPDSAPVTIAFIGLPAAHKGWPSFEKLVTRLHSRKDAFKFVYFGTSPISATGVRTIPVHVTEGEPDAMIQAITAHDVDLVLHWASWQETFSFSTYEALAGGAWVLTNPGSGNVAVTVRETGKGVVLQDESDLHAFFEDGRMERIVAQRRAAKGAGAPVLTRSDMIYTVLQDGGAL